MLAHRVFRPPVRIERRQDVYRLERRGAPRWAVSGRVTAVTHEPTPDGTRHRILSLLLCNMSATGLGVLAQDEIPDGSDIVLLIPAHGAERGFDLAGRVVRSRRCEQGHEIGIHFNTRLAA